MSTTTISVTIAIADKENISFNIKDNQTVEEIHEMVCESQKIPEEKRKNYFLWRGHFGKGSDFEQRLKDYEIFTIKPASGIEIKYFFRQGTFAPSLARSLQEPASSLHIWKPSLKTNDQFRNRGLSLGQSRTLSQKKIKCI